MPTNNCHTCHSVTPTRLTCGNESDSPSDTPASLSPAEIERERVIPAVPLPTAVPERALYRIPEAMRLLSMSRSVIYEQLRAGRLRSVTQGRARLIPAKAIQDYVALLMRESEVDYDQTA